MTYKTTDEAEGASVVEAEEAEYRKSAGCPRFRGCGAPICPEDKGSLESACWQAGEELCSRRDFQALQWMAALRKLARRRKNPPDGYFTVEMLGRLRSVRGGTAGIDPEYPERREAWLKAHPARQPRKHTEAELQVLRDRLQDARRSSKKAYLDRVLSPSSGIMSDTAAPARGPQDMPENAAV
jgi:hypothetical protein